MKVKHDNVPCPRFFLFAERLCKTIGTPGGRILLLLAVTLVFYGAALFGMRQSAWPGGVCLLAFLRTVRNPSNAPGMLSKLLRRKITT
jgi:hypothetical protein